MKKIIYLISILFFFHLLIGCAGYKPIFGSSNVKFNISEHLVEGEKEIGNKIYSKLNNLSKSQDEFPDSALISLTVNAKKNKEKMSIDTSGKTTEYKITITADVNIKNYLTNKSILIRTFKSSSLYKVQPQYSDTVKMENRTVEELIQKIYRDILIVLSEKIAK